MLFSGDDVDDAIKFSDWKFLADLADDLKLRCVDVARGSMFNDAHHKYWQASGQIDLFGKEIGL